MAIPLQFWFEFASTYSYPAAMRVAQVAAAQGVAVHWRAFLLGPIFKAQGWNNSPFNIYPAKGRYMWRDVERICEELQLPFKRPSVFPRNGLIAARVACQFAHQPWMPDFIQAVYQANFAHDRDISSASVVGECLEQAGQAPSSILSAAESAEAKQQLRDQTDEAVRLGVFGAPWFVCGDEMFWGNDRLERAVSWCAGHAISR